MQSDELFYEIKDHFTRRLYPGCIRRFVERIYNDVCRDLGWDLEDVLEALYKFAVTRLLRAMLACGVKGKNNVAEGVRLVTELDEDRSK